MADKLLEQEKIVDLYWGGYRLIQSPQYFCLSIDSVLLADFITNDNYTRVAEFGSGIGGLTLLLAAKFRTSEINAFELNSLQENVLKRNVALNNLENRINVLNLDIRNINRENKERFDLVVFNPPYFKENAVRISKNKIKAEANVELNGKLADFISKGAEILKTNGKMAMVLPFGRSKEAEMLLKANDLTLIRKTIVYSKSDSPAYLVLLEAEKSHLAKEIKLDEIIIFGGNGEYTSSLKQIFHKYKKEEA